jgi:hypothetical protein
MRLRVQTSGAQLTVIPSLNWTICVSLRTSPSFLLARWRLFCFSLSHHGDARDVAPLAHLFVGEAVDGFDFQTALAPAAGRSSVSPGTAPQSLASRLTRATNP